METNNTRSLTQQRNARAMPDILADIDRLAAACKQGDIASVTSLLHKHPDVLDSPDRDTRFPYRSRVSGRRCSSLRSTGTSRW